MKNATLALFIALVGACAAKTQQPEAAPAETKAPAETGPAAEAAPEVEVPPLDPRYVWDLTDLYPTVEAWDAARQDVLAQIEKLPRHKGTLGKSAAHMKAVAEEVYAVQKEGVRVFRQRQSAASEPWRLWLDHGFEGRQSR